MPRTSRTAKKTTTKTAATATSKSRKKAVTINYTKAGQTKNTSRK